MTQPYYYDRVPLGGPSKPKRSRWPWIVVALVATFALCGIGTISIVGVGAHAVTQEEKSRVADVHLTGCHRTMFGVDVTYTLTNSSATERSYLVEVRVKNGDGTIVGQANDLTPQVPAGHTLKGTATGTVDGDGALTCELVSA